MGRTILTLISLWLLLSFGSCTLWDQVFPSPTDGTINSGVYGPEGFLLVGDQGLMLSSLNGTNWEMCYSPLDGDYEYSSFTNGYYIRTNQGQGTTAYGPTLACHNYPEWQDLGNFLGDFSLDFQFAPAPVPNGYTGPFIGISNHKAYISQTGTPMDMGEITAIDYNLFEAWAVYYANNTFMIKLAGKPETTIEFDIYFISSPDGQNWTNPMSSGYSAFYDYSLSFCSVSQKWIMAANEGICVSTDGVTWYLTFASPNFKFAKMDCYGDRCVASNYTNLFDSNNCKYFQENTPIGLVMSDGFPIVSSTGTFVVAGRMGAIQYSNTYLAWYASGAPYSQTGEYVNCDELIAGDNFYLSCMQSIFVSSNGTKWTYKPYSLSSNTTLQITNLLYADEQLIAIAGLNKIYISTNAGNNWQFVLQIDTESDNPPSIETLKYTGSKIVGIGQTPWGSSSTIIPFLAIADSVDSWAYFATSAWLYDVVYFPATEYWLGAGEGGIYYSDNFYDWNVMSSVNGYCSAIVYESSLLVALCYNQGTGNAVDQVIKLSSDGHTWDNYNSPCTQTYRSPVLPQTCSQLSFVPAWDRFVLFSENATGTIYASINGTSWSLVEFPFAMGLYSIVQLNETIATLTDDSVLTGSTGSTSFLIPQALTPYTGSTSSSYNPNYPKVGPIGTQSVGGFSSDANSSSSDGGMNGGSIFGIIVAVCVVVFVASIIVGGVVYFLIVKKSRRNNEARPILAGADENDML